MSQIPIFAVKYFRALRGAKIALGCLAAFALSGCDGLISLSNKGCEVYTPGTEPTHGTFEFSGRQQTLNTGMKVKSGEEVLISVKGVIDLCPGSASVSPENASFPLTAQKGEWQESPFPVRKDRPFTLRIDGNYSDMTGKKDKGAGLYALIATEEYFEANKTKLNEKLFYASPIYGDDHTAFGGKEEYEFFELSRAGDTQGTVSIQFPSDKNGRIYFRYARNAEARGVSNEGEASMRFTPWDGEYKWIKRCQDCQSSGFANSPLCLDHKIGGANCADGTHWANGDYKLNTGGYTITYAANCLVHDGQGLFYSLSPEGQDKEPQMEYKAGSTHKIDCTVNNPKVCTESRDAAGSILFRKKPEGTEFLPGGKFLDAEIDQGGSMTKPAKAASEGFIRFTLKDEKQKVSDLYSDGGCSSKSKSVEPRCCFVNPWPKDEALFKGYTDAGCGKITGGQPICTKFDDSCIPAAGLTGYADNEGQYQISVTVIKKPKIIRFLRPVSEAVHRVFFGSCTSGEIGVSSAADCKGQWKPGVSQEIFQNFVKDPKFHTLIRSLFALVIVFYGYVTMVGSNSKPASTTIMHVFRMGFVAILMDPNAWQILDQFIFSFFIKGSESFIMMIQNGILDQFYQFTETVAKSNAVIENLPDPSKTGDFLPLSYEDPFDFFYYLYYWIFTHDNFRRIVSFSLWKFPLGIGVFLFIIFEIFMYFFLILRIFVVFVLSKMLLGFLALISPIFFLFILFNKTRDYFLKWVFMSAQYMLQPVVGTFTAAILNLILFSLFYKLISLDYCYQCLLPAVPIFPFTLIKGHCLLYSFQPQAKLDGVFFIAFIILAVIDTGTKVTDWMMKAIGSIFVGMGQLGIEREALWSLGGAISQAAGAGSSALSIGKAAASKAGGAAVKAASNAATRAPRGGANLPKK